jgi:hypothetical protein
MKDKLDLDKVKEYILGGADGKIIPVPIVEIAGVKYYDFGFLTSEQLKGGDTSEEETSEETSTEASEA